MKEAIDLKRALEMAKTKSEELRVNDGGMINYSLKSDRNGYFLYTCHHVRILTHSRWYIM